jgi:hypothetical protein
MSIYVRRFSFIRNEIQLRFQEEFKLTSQASTAAGPFSLLLISLGSPLIITMNELI